MKIMKLALCAGVSLAAMTAHAHADPISIGNAVFAFLYSAGLPGAIANAIAIATPYALAAGAVAASAFARPRAGAVNPADAKSTFETGDSSIMEGIGRVRIGGLQAFGNTDGSTRARVVCRLQGPTDEIETYYIGGREVTVEANGDVSSPPWARPGGSWAKWLDKRGDNTDTAWADLIALFPTLWTSAHILPGIAHSMLLWFNPGLSEPKFLSLYQNGAPTTEQVRRASLMYDPFDESCDVDDPATWVWSDNGILAAAHVLRRDPAFISDRFDWTLITLEAAKAASHVATRTGTEPRARAWGIWAWEDARNDTMQQLLDSIGARIRYTDAGKIWFQLIDDAVSSEISFTKEDDYDLFWRSGPEAVERPNICRVKYYSPERNYDLAEITLLQFDEAGNNIGAPWAYIADEVARYGPKYLDVELPFCPSASQAQRIARQLFELARGDTGTAKTSMVGLAAWGLLYASFELPDLGDVLVTRIEPPRCDDETGSVDIPFTVWPALAPWNPAVDEMPAPDVIPEMGYETDMITPDAPTGALQITYPDASKEFRIGYSLPDQDFDTVEATYRTYTGSLPNAYQSMSESDVVAWVATDLTGQTVDARVRVFNGDDGTYWSPVLHAVVGVDNSPPPAPEEIDVVITGSSESTAASITVTVRANALNAASMLFRRRIRFSTTWSDYTDLDQENARPGQEFTFSNVAPGDPEEIEWQVIQITSNGTLGTPLTYTSA